MPRKKTLSKQPRLAEERRSAFSSVVRWLKMAELEEPPYGTHSRVRDAWLQRFWMREPHLAGVVNAVVLIDTNRGWQLTGGRNQVLRYSDILHSSDDGAGWRHFIRKVSLSYWTTDIGAIVEIGRDGPNGPLRALYSVDSARCQLTGNPSYPLEYSPVAGRRQLWRSSDFFRVVSMPSPIEELHDLGWCAVSRALELAKILLAIYQHDSEKLTARMPRGILFLDNITEEQWEESLRRREADLSAEERMFYGGVQIIASGGGETANARLVALSALPDGFDRETFVQQVMYGFALCFGHDPSEFWPLSYGALGRGTETEMQHRKASGKGGLDFTTTFQESLQDNLPETLEFRFDSRDETGERLSAEVMNAKITAVRQAYEAGLAVGAPLLTREEARQLLVDAGVIPPEWTEIQEEVVKQEDTQRQLMRARAKESDFIQRAARTFPDEPIVTYRYRIDGSRLVTLYDRGSQVHPFRIHVPEKLRATVLFQGEGWQITEDDVTQAIQQAQERVGDEFAQLLVAPAYPAQKEEEL